MEALSRGQFYVLDHAARSENGRAKLSARSHYRRSADALVRRGLLRFCEADQYLAYFEVTKEGRARHEAMSTR